MNKILILFAFTLLSIPLYAQRFAIVDTQYILENMPEYKVAQENIEKHIKGWSAEVKRLEDEIERGRASLYEKKILLTEDLYQQREKVLFQREEELKLLKNRIYGPDGDIVKMRVKLIIPIQNRIYNAVKIVSEKEKFSFVFDKSSDLVLIYSDPKSSFDITERVLRRLRLVRANEIKEAEENDAEQQPSETSDQNQEKTIN